MLLEKNTYLTFKGKLVIYEIPRKKETQFVIYENGSPKYYTDFYDLEKEENAMMNSLVICTKNSIDYVLKALNKKHNISLSAPRKSKLLFKKRISSEKVNVILETLPIKWLSYSL